MIHTAPIESQIAGIFLALIEGRLVGPHQIFFETITYPHGVVGRMSLVGSECFVIGRFQQIHAHILAREIIDRLVIGFELGKHIGGIGDGGAIQHDANAGARRFQANLVVGKFDKARRGPGQSSLVIHNYAPFINEMP